jgi:hypothetical protein
VFEKFSEPLECSIRAIFIPYPQREQRKQVNEIVIDQDSQCYWREKLDISPAKNVMKDIHRDDVFIGPVGFAIPVVKNMKTVLSVFFTECLYDSAEIDFVRSGLEMTRTHAVAQPHQRLAEILRS